MRNGQKPSGASRFYDAREAAGRREPAAARPRPERSRAEAPDHSPPPRRRADAGRDTPEREDYEARRSAPAGRVDDRGDRERAGVRHSSLRDGEDARRSPPATADAWDRAHARAGAQGVLPHDRDCPAPA